MILLDTNILMYAAGAEHAFKQPSARLLERIARGEIAATLDAETLQEILHRYRAINRWADGAMLYDLTRKIFPNVIPISGDIVDRARELMDTSASLTARDALHAAVVQVKKLDAICSYDRDFDQVAFLRRVEP